MIFFYDKQAAKSNKQRISESTLHFLEMTGGVFFILFLMYFIRHKNLKYKYLFWTWTIGCTWLMALYIIIYKI